MTQEQRQNLEKLATYLEQPELKAKFDMRTFAVSSHETVNCGSVGCAIGHGPYAGIREHEKPYESWDEYCLQSFGIDTFGSREYNYLFTSFWSRIDNTPLGAAKRIRTFLESGVPEDFNEDSFFDEDDDQ